MAHLTDFKNDYSALSGKLVLHVHGMSYSSTLSKSIKRITIVTKTGFRISNTDALFSLTDGYQKGLTSRMDMGRVSHCELISEEEAEELRSKWRKKRVSNTIIAEVTVKLKTLDYEQLIALSNFINDLK